MSAQLQSFDDDRGGGLKIDFKRVLYRVVSYWYLVVISLVVALTIAYYQVRYAEKIYPVTASIMIRETQETGGAELLYKNALIDPYRNYLNEPYILKSIPLVRRVVQDLNFNVAFYREGYFMTTDAYEYMPVEARWCNPNDVKAGKFIFTLVDDNHYTLDSYPEHEKTKSKPFVLNDSIDYKGYRLCIGNRPGRETHNFVNVPFLLVINDLMAVTLAYSGRLSVRWAEEGSGVINLGMNSANPAKELDFLDHFISQYQQLDLDKKNEAAERTINFIKSELATMQDSLRQVEVQLEKFGNSARVKDLSSEAERMLKKLEPLELQKTELIIRERYFDYFIKYLGEGNNLDQIVLPEAAGVADAVLGGLVQKMIDLQIDIKLYHPDQGVNPLVAKKMERINEIKRDIQESIRSLQTTDQIKLDYITKQIEILEKQLEVLPGSERRLVSVQRNYTLLENLWIYLEQKLAEAGISKAANTTDIIRINPPMKGGAISPKPTQNFTVAAIFGFLIPFVMFVLVEVLNDKVQSREDIEKISMIPFLGGIGHNTHGHQMVVSAKPRSEIAESFRSLRSNLNYFVENQTRKVIMISSSISGEGKTFTTINLATVFAMSGRRTLIIGADMRRPKIFSDFNLDNSVGLSGYLSNLNTMDQIVQKTSIENLDLVSGGPVPPNPSELLLTERFENFLKEALKSYDYIIIDTPPMALVTDALIISKHVDHTVFVVRQNYTPKMFLKSIGEYVENGKLRNVSVLLNDIFKTGLGYGYGAGYGYNTGYTYGYYVRRRKNGHGYYHED